MRFLPGLAGIPHHPSWPTGWGKIVYLDADASQYTSAVIDSVQTEYGEGEPPASVETYRFPGGAPARGPFTGGGTCVAAHYLRFEAWLRLMVDACNPPAEHPQLYSLHNSARLMGIAGGWAGDYGGDEWVLQWLVWDAHLQDPRNGYFISRMLPRGGFSWREYVPMESHASDEACGQWEEEEAA